MGELRRTVACAVLLLIAGKGIHAADAVRQLTFLEVAGTDEVRARTSLRSYVRTVLDRAPRSNVLLLQQDARPGLFVLLESAADGDVLTRASDAASRELRPLQALLVAPEDRRTHRELQDSAAAEATRDATAPGLVAIAHLDIGPGRGSAEGALRAFARAAREAPGNLSFEVWQQTDRPNHFNLVSGWRTAPNHERFAAGAAAREFRRAVGPSLGSPYDERLYRRAN